jgi:hypothetical protein
MEGRLLPLLVFGDHRKTFGIVRVDVRIQILDRDSSGTFGLLSPVFKMMQIEFLLR